MHLLPITKISRSVMSEEKINQELSADELKDVDGGAKINPKQIGKRVKGQGVQSKNGKDSSLWGSGDDGFTDKSTPIMY